MSGDTGLNLVLAFDTDDPEFARGFEVGRFYEMFVHQDGDLNGQAIHASNAEMILRIAAAADRPMSADFTDDPAWMVLRG